MNPVTETDTDRQLLEETWRQYDDFAELVGDIVSPYEYLSTEEQVDLTAQIFMFAYALGSVAGAQTAAPDDFTAETDLDRVEAIVDHVINVHDSEEFAVSSSRVEEDFLEG